VAPDEYRAAFEKLVDVSLDQTKLLTEQSMLLRELVKGQANDKVERALAVSSVKEHINEAIAAGFGVSESWWRRAFLIAVGLIMLSNLVGVALTKFWDALHLAH
jgi:hypothetical protein